MKVTRRMQYNDIKVALGDLLYSRLTEDYFLASQYKEYNENDPQFILISLDTGAVAFSSRETNDKSLADLCKRWDMEVIAKKEDLILLY